MTALSIQNSTPGGIATADHVDGSALLGVYRQPPMTIVRGEGVELRDAEGKSYIDFTSGIGVNALGYGDAGIEQAMRDAMESGVLHTSNLYFTAPAGRLAAELARLSSLDKVFFCNSGAEANEGAFKFARRWAREMGGPAKHEIVALRGAFHGRLFASLAATDRPQYRAPFRPLAGGVRVVERDARSLDRSVNAETTAALVVEPVQGEGGIRVLDPAFLRELRDLTAERGVALILDEIQCGLGRTGWFLAHQRAGVVPDMVTLAKPLAGGLPMGAVLISKKIAAAMRPGDHGTTFGGGPFVASVALHVIERLADGSLLEHVRDTGAWIGEQLGAIASRTGKVRAVRGIGYMWGIDVMQPAGEVVSRAREAGLLICGAGEHTLRILPPLIAGRDDLARGLSILEEVL
ncbi:MAG TPA: acetylornithine transaminase [Gemmatimonadaceae bacterium]|nr:acetylornithine transaminase [Gemmatimonadaceae bacterium]